MPRPGRRRGRHCRGGREPSPVDSHRHARFVSVNQSTRESACFRLAFRRFSLDQRDVDALASREAFLHVARRVSAPILLVYGAETPPKSRAEMEALAAVPGVRTVRLSQGKLAVHEEFPDETMDAIAPFLSEEVSSAAMR